jgi:hypothetical protein
MTSMGRPSIMTPETAALMGLSIDGGNPFITVDAGDRTIDVPAHRSC